jgi:Tol biopolymer transport system component
MTVSTGAGVAALALVAACGPLEPRAPRGGATYAVVTTERGPRGGRLVFVAEDGRRMAELTHTEVEPTVDTHPSWSPDGKWIVFASSRGREGLEASSLWVIPARSQSAPRRLTSEGSVDRDPVWSARGDAIVFASNVRGSFDLWKLPVRPGNDGWPAVAGQGVRLTGSDTDELSPAVSPDGRWVVYAQLDRATQRSQLWRVSTGGGKPRRLTSGPADLTPAVSPDGRQLAFAAPVKGQSDTELFVAEADGTGRRRVIAEPYADQTGPVWSRDGRYLFATSVYRSQATGSPVLSSIVVIDLEDRRPVMRALHDPAVVESRLGVALAPRRLDAGALRANAVYIDALRRAVTERVRSLRDRGQPAEP